MDSSSSSNGRPCRRRLAGARDRLSARWFHQFADNVGSTSTDLGAERVRGQTINGVVNPVNGIEATKQLETGFTAVQLSADDFVRLDGGGPLQLSGDVNVYIVAPRKSMGTTAQFAAQSQTLAAGARNHTAILQMPCDEVSAERNRRCRDFGLNPRRSRLEKPSPLGRGRLAQVHLLRILTVCGEVAERLKAAVC